MFKLVGLGAAVFKFFNGLFEWFKANQNQELGALKQNEANRAEADKNAAIANKAADAVNTLPARDKYQRD